MTVYAYSDLVRAVSSNLDAAHVASIARVNAEIAADDAARAARAATTRTNARRNAACKVVREFRAVLARFEREAPNTDEANDVIRLANRADITLRNGGHVEGLAAIICEMARLMP